MISRLWNKFHIGIWAFTSLTWQCPIFLTEYIMWGSDQKFDKDFEQTLTKHEVEFDSCAAQIVYRGHSHHSDGDHGNGIVLVTDEKKKKNK